METKLRPSKVWQKVILFTLCRRRSLNAMHSNAGSAHRGKSALQPECFGTARGDAECRHRAGPPGKCKRCGDPRAHGWKYLPLRRISKHGRGDPGCKTGNAAGMRPFTYSRPKDTADAVTALASEVNAKVLGGGTNLLDLLKMGVEHPAHLVDITISRRTNSYGNVIRCSARPCWRALPRRFATWRQRVAT
jgi:FAD binding domain in molybdopterin dehydrogenase